MHDLPSVHRSQTKALPCMSASVEPDESGRKSEWMAQLSDLFTTTSLRWVTLQALLLVKWNILKKVLLFLEDKTKNTEASLEILQRTKDKTAPPLVMCKHRRSSRCANLWSSLVPGVPRWQMLSVLCHLISYCFQWQRCWKDLFWLYFVSPLRPPPPSVAFFLWDFLHYLKCHHD